MSEDFRGAASIRVGSTIAEVPVRLSAHFEPLEGRLRWAGRTAPEPALVALYRAGERNATISVDGGDFVAAKLGEPDPWGGIRLTGTGYPPWPYS